MKRSAGPRFRTSSFHACVSQRKLSVKYAVIAPIHTRGGCGATAESLTSTTLISSIEMEKIMGASVSGTTKTIARAMGRMLKATRQSHKEGDG